VYNLLVHRIDKISLPGHQSLHVAQKEMRANFDTI